MGGLILCGASSALLLAKRGHHTPGQECNDGLNLLCKYPVGLVIMSFPSLVHQPKGAVKVAHWRCEWWVGCCRFSMSLDAMRSPGALERQSSGVVKDVQKSAQAGIGALASHLPALQMPSPTLLNQDP